MFRGLTKAAAGAIVASWSAYATVRVDTGDSACPGGTGYSLITGAGSVSAGVTAAGSFNIIASSSSGANWFNPATNTTTRWIKFTSGVGGCVVTKNGGTTGQAFNTWFSFPSTDYFELNFTVPPNGSSIDSSADVTVSIANTSGGTVISSGTIAMAVGGT
jgi:hypothetical protein